jgi:hypothetical protein
MHFNDKSGSVHALQERLIALGHPLPRFGADGHLGDETWEALAQAAHDLGIVWRPEVPPEVLRALEQVHTPQKPPAAPSAPRPSVPIVDVRDRIDQAHPRTRVVAGNTVVRAPSAVNTIVVHQTAVRYTAGPVYVREAQGNQQLALALRAAVSPYHVMAMRAGFVAALHPLRSYTHHANALNRMSLGLSIEGHYPPLKRHRGNFDAITDDLVLVSRAALHLLVTEARQAGMPITRILAHRQSNAKRRGDPGEELWAKLVLEYAVPVLGLATDPSFTIGTGRALAREWDPAGPVRY